MKRERIIKQVLGLLALANRNQNNSAHESQLANHFSLVGIKCRSTRDHWT